MNYDYDTYYIVKKCVYIYRYTWITYLDPMRFEPTEIEKLGFYVNGL